MENFNFQSDTVPCVLGTDLDGTLIPLPGSVENRRDLQVLAEGMQERGLEIVFATGRHFASALGAIREYGLPLPNWMVCDVGTSIFRRVGGEFQPFEPYASHLCERIGDMDRTAVEEGLAGLDGITLQEAAAQGPFKISYYAEAAEVDSLVDAVTAACVREGLPFDCMGSVDPFDKRGLLDLLPAGVSKAYALIWLATHADFKPEELLYAGDSGNDYAALVAGFRSVAVGNMEPALVEKIASEMAEKGAGERFYAAKGKATSGVLEGARHFGLL